MCRAGARSGERRPGKAGDKQRDGWGPGRGPKHAENSLLLLQCAIARGRAGLGARGCSGVSQVPPHGTPARPPARAPELPGLPEPLCLRDGEGSSSPLATPVPAWHHALPGLGHPAALGALTAVVLSVAAGPARMASPRNLLEVGVVRPHLRPAESEPVGVGPSTLLGQAPGDAKDGPS